MGLSLRNRILLAFLTSFALFLGALGYGTWQLQSMGEGLQVLNEGYLPLARMGAELDSTRERLDLDTEKRDSRPLAAFRASAGFHANGIRAAAGRGFLTAGHGSEVAEDPDEKRAFIAIQDQLHHLTELADRYEEAAQAWLERAEAGDALGLQAAQAELLQRSQALETAVETLNATVDAGIRRANVQVAGIQARTTMVGAIVAGLAMLLGAVMMGWILLTLRPITRLTTEVQRVAAGDYSGRVDIQGGHEIGVLATEFNAMAQALAERDRRLVERARELERVSGWLRSVLDAIRIGLVVVEDERVTMANPAAHRSWGVQQGQPLPPPLDALEPGRHPALQVGELQFDLELLPFGAEGSLVLGEDITERLATQQRLERSERLALIGQMLAQVTHEVRNPLNAISLNAELLAEELTELAAQGPEATEILATIIQEIQRLEQVTEHYLDLARHPTPDIEPEEIGALVRSVCRLEEPAFQRAGVSLELALPEEPVVLPVDGNQLRRALLNVLRNALQSGGQRVQVQVQAHPEGVTITVADDGQGMEPDALERAFDPFFSQRSKGTGLGLAITRQILDDHGGRVRAESSRSAGFTVQLDLPR
jgi:nitrogen fixation/metabolism regulation signal transduction histidine kinase